MSEIDSTNEPSEICFMHVSHEYREYFTHKHPEYPSFYWFTDRFYDHLCSGKLCIDGSPGWKYFYFFIKNPKEDNIKFRSRHGNHGFDGLYKRYLSYKNYLSEVGKKSGQYDSEPGMLNSYSLIKPNLIAEFNEDIKDFMVVYPKKFRFLRLFIFDKNNVSKPFLETRLPELFPEIKSALPITKPTIKDDEFYFKNWIDMEI